MTRATVLMALSTLPHSEQQQTRVGAWGWGWRWGWGWGWGGGLNVGGVISGSGAPHDEPAPRGRDAL